MVVGCKSRQLFRSGKHMTFSKRFSVRPSNNAVGFNNYSSVRLSSMPSKSRGAAARLWCDCKQLHYSKETSRSVLTKLSPQEVDNILRANEYSHEFKKGSVKSYDSNQLSSNNPIEDTRSEASCLLTTEYSCVSGFLVGVFDGHGGGACAQVIAKRLFSYITACLLPHENLLQYVTQPEPPDLLESHNDKVQFVEDVRDIYRESFMQFVKELAEEELKLNFEMSRAIERAFMRLDEDLSKEAMPKDGKVNMKTLSVAMSGAVSCIAHIDGPHLHVAGVGDCCAVLGT